MDPLPPARTAPRPGTSATQYGGVTKTFHWLTALLILTAFPLGVVAHEWPYDTSAQLGVKAVLFSLHKTLGVAAFVLGLARIAWAIGQPRPLPLRGPRWQVFAAETVHLTLYGALVAVPLSGWLHHAATTGFAPIWWPLGQGLPFVPQSQPLAEFFAALHGVFTKVLLAAVLLHVGAALKHHLIDRDTTLRRMLPGAAPAAPTGAHGGRAPVLAALAIWALALGGGTLLGLPAQTAPRAGLAPVASDWQVTEGRLAITVTQLGSAVTGQFADWTAQIAYDPETATGAVEVRVATPSLSLGGVTAQALEPEFLDAEAHPLARFHGPIRRDGDGLLVDGTLSIVGRDLPLPLPFSLAITGDQARATGRVTLDRRDLGMGPSYPDESTVGFAVQIDLDLSATRAP